MLKNGVVRKFHFKITMKNTEKIINFAPVLFPAFGFILWAALLSLDQFTKIPSILVWLPFVLIQIVTSVFLGILIKKLNYMAHCDLLTGLYSRRYFNYKLSEEMLRIQRTHSSLSLILIDVDNFKKVNDTNGHIMGDEVLKKIGYILKSNIRSIDIAARWGGEEFVIILPETNLNGANTFAERLRKTVENYDFGVRVTISLGVVSTCDEISIEELLTQVDEALYSAKEIKNKVVTYSKPQQ